MPVEHYWGKLPAQVLKLTTARSRSKELSGVAMATPEKKLTFPMASKFWFLNSKIFRMICISWNVVVWRDDYVVVWQETDWNTSGKEGESCFRVRVWVVLMRELEKGVGRCMSCLPLKELEQTIVLRLGENSAVTPFWNISNSILEKQMHGNTRK